MQNVPSAGSSGVDVAASWSEQRGSGQHHQRLQRLLAGAAVAVRGLDTPRLLLGVLGAGVGACSPAEGSQGRRG